MLKKYLLISLIVIVSIVFVAIKFWPSEDVWLCQNGVWIKYGNPKQSPPLTVCAVNLVKDNLKACTMEAKLCPDGSAVGRTGSNCEFAPCPEINTDSEIR